MLKKLTEVNVKLDDDSPESFDQKDITTKITAKTIFPKKKKNQ